MLKKSVVCLGFTLSQCAKSHTRLESLFRTKQVPSMHAHHPRHTHAPHGHHHSMYAHVYTCTHCGRGGHLAKFCFDRLHTSNLAKNFVWVRNETNPHGPNKIWVPKITPRVFDVGVGSHMTWELPYLGVDAFWASWKLIGCITFKGRFGGDDHHVLETIFYSRLFTCFSYSLFIACFIVYRLLW